MATVLAVDDELPLLDLYERLFRRVGFDVVTAASLAEARRCLRETAIDVVVTDRRLPDGDGTELVREARSLPEPIPSILVTGFGAESAEDAYAAGASRFFVKPFNVVALATAVRELACTASQARAEVLGGLCSCPP